MLALIDDAERAARRGDIVTADRIRNELYGLGELGSHFAARIVDEAIIKARAAGRRPNTEDLRRIA
jgi:hypothetical protein